MNSGRASSASHHAPRPALNQRGLGLVELMIAISITAVVLVAMYGSFFKTQHSAQRVMGQVDARQGIRAAVQLLERDLRMAGSGWGRIDVNGANNGQALTVRSLNPGFGGAGAGNDSITLIGGWDASTTLRAGMANTSAVIQCVNTTGFAVNDLVVVTNGASAHLFQVTSVTGPSPGDLGHDSGSPFNISGSSGHANFPPGTGYPSGTRVFRTGWVTYKIDSTTFRRPALVRREFGKSAQLVAENVESFQVWYRMADGTVTRNPINLPLIEQVQPVVRTRPTANAAADSVWAAVRPRTF